MCMCGCVDALCVGECWCVFGAVCVWMMRVSVWRMCGGVDVWWNVCVFGECGGDARVCE